MPLLLYKHGRESYLRDGMEVFTIRAGFPSGPALSAEAPERGELARGIWNAQLVSAVLVRAQGADTESPLPPGLLRRIFHLALSGHLGMRIVPAASEPHV